MSYPNVQLTSSPQPDLSRHQAQKLYQQGDERAFRGDNATAIDYYTQALALAPDSILAYCARGEALLQIEQFDRAETDYQMALKLSPKLALANGGLARAYAGNGNYPKALVACNRAIQQERSNIDFYYYRALINKKLADTDGVLRDCKIILENQPTHLPARWLNASAHFQLGNYKLALFNFNRYLTLESTDFQAYYYRGICHERLGNLSSALIDLNRAIELQPKRAILFRRRGRIARQLGDFTAAMADFDRAIGIDPYLGGAYANRADIYLSRGDYPQALSECNRAIYLDPVSVEAYYLRGIINTEVGNLHAALADYHHLIQINPQDLNAYLQRGWIYFRCGHYTAVIDDCQQILTIDRNSVPANYLMGVAQLLSGFKQEAIFSFSRAIDLAPSFVCALYHRGLLQHDLKSANKAMDDFALAREIQDRGTDSISKHDETGLYAEGLALYYMGHLDTARAILYQAALIAQKLKSAIFHQQIVFTIEALGMS